jgi:hypothetical protein
MLGRDDTLRWLKENGVGYVMIPFYGGGDEGTCETPYLFASENDVGNLQAELDLKEPPFVDVAEVLGEEPLYESMGSYGDGEGISGYVTWNLESGEAQISYSVEEYVDQEPIALTMPKEIA